MFKKKLIGHVSFENVPCKPLSEIFRDGFRQSLGVGRCCKPEVKTKMDDFRERMRSLMTWRKEEWPYEYNYWVTHHNL